MTVRCCHAAILILFVVSLSGCNVSLHSTQYAFVKNLLKAEPPVAKKNWQVTWRQRIYPVYAVNHSGGIYFANESGFLASFDGFQEMRLSLPGYQNRKEVQLMKMVLDDGTMSLQFQVEGGRNLGSHTCSSWQMVAPQNGLKGWDQACAYESDMYTNEIRVNVQGQIVALKQVLMPGFPPIVIEQRL